MPDQDFHEVVKDYIETAYRLIGVRLDERLCGYKVADAVHVNIDPAISAIVQTELQIVPRMRVDLRELEDIRPPIDKDNIFITFSADSANFRGGNAVAFGIHMTRPSPSREVIEALNAGVFVPGTQVAQIYQMIVYVRSPSGDVSLARTGTAIGLDPEDRLVSYLTFQSDQGLIQGAHNPPSRLNNADRQVMLYIFLALSTFMAVNQGESPLHWLNAGTAVIG